MSAPTGFNVTPVRSSYDVIIIGGAMYGSAVAWFLTNNPDFDGSVLVIERDPSYEFSSTAHTNSCIRQQFTQEINIRISQFGAEFINDFKDFMGNDPRVPDLGIQNFGYMFLADSPQALTNLQNAQVLQNACGVNTVHMDPDEIAKAYPFYNVSDVLGCNHNRENEGYFDGNTIFDWWKRSAREHGAEYLSGEVISMTQNAKNKNIESVTLRSGQTIACGLVVNASGPRASATAAMAGLSLPVEPRKRYTFIFAAETPLDQDLPLTIDPSGVHMRTDGRYYMAGCPPDDDPAVAFDDFEQDFQIWEDKVWPAIANRIPQFEAIKLINSWAGHYAFNTLDQNAILGRHPAVDNFIFANGFSGHGFQQSPALARGISELITYGKYRTLDLSPLDISRVINNEPFIETAVI